MKELFKNLKFTWKYAKNEKKYFIVTIISNIMWIAISIILPILSAKIIMALTNNDFIRIISIAIMLLVINTLGNIFKYISRVASIKIYRNTLTKLEIELGENILRLENKCLDDNGSGVFIQRMTNDTSRLADIFNNLLSQISGIIQYIGIIVAIFIVNKLIFIYCIVMVITLFTIERIRTIKRNEDDKVQRKSREKLSSFIGELVRGARDIKMLNSEKDFVNELKTIIEDNNDKKIIMQKRSWGYKFLSGFSIDIFEFILIVLLVILMKKNIIDGAIALVLYNYVNKLEWSSWIAGNFLEYLKDFNLSSDRIYAILNDDEFKKERFGTSHIDNVKGNFEFKNVSFSYDKNKVLKDLSFKIKAKETIAFVGKSGAGKTTIFNLLCKMYDTYKGEITIDGIDIRNLDKDSIRGNITIISQNPYIFNMSIRDN